MSRCPLCRQGKHVRLRSTREWCCGFLPGSTPTMSGGWFRCCGAEPADFRADLPLVAFVGFREVGCLSGGAGVSVGGWTSSAMGVRVLGLPERSGLQDGGRCSRSRTRPDFGTWCGCTAATLWRPVKSCSMPAEGIIPGARGGMVKSSVSGRGGARRKAGEALDRAARSRSLPTTPFNQRGDQGRLRACSQSEVS